MSFLFLSSQHRVFHHVVLEYLNQRRGLRREAINSDRVQQLTRRCTEVKRQQLAQRTAGLHAVHVESDPLMTTLTGEQKEPPGSAFFLSTGEQIKGPMVCPFFRWLFFSHWDDLLSATKEKDLAQGGMVSLHANC